MKRINFIGRISLIGILCFLFTIHVSFAQENEEKQIKTTYQEYIKSIKNHDGLKAAQLIDSKTIVHYDTLWNLIKTGDSVQIAALSFTDMMTVLNFRQIYWQSNLNYELVAEYNGTYFFAFGVKSESFGSMEPPKWALGNISINGNTAQAQCIDGKKKTPFSLVFNKENNIWKFSLISLIDIVDSTINRICEEKSMPVLFFVDYSLRSKYGQVHPNIWKPLITE